MDTVTVLTGHRHWVRWCAATGYGMGGITPFFLDRARYTERDAAKTMQKFGRRMLRDGCSESTVDKYIGHVQQLHKDTIGYAVAVAHRPFSQWRKALRVLGSRAPNRARAATRALLVAASKRRLRHRRGKQGDRRRGGLDVGVVGAMEVAFFCALRRKEYLAYSRRRARPLQLHWRRVRFFREGGIECHWGDSRRAYCAMRIYRKCSGGRHAQWLPLYPYRKSVV